MVGSLNDLFVGLCRGVWYGFRDTPSSTESRYGLRELSCEPVLLPPVFEDWMGSAKGRDAIVNFKWAGDSLTTGLVLEKIRTCF